MCGHGHLHDGRPNSLYLRPDIDTVLEKGGIVCMQETLYSKQDLDILNNLHPNFSGTDVSTTAYHGGPARGRPPGGSLLGPCTGMKFRPRPGPQI